MDYGIITSIAEVEGVRDNYYTLDGYKISTADHTIRVLISSNQQCCESWGYFASEDDLSAFVGAALQEIRLTDTALKQEVVEASCYGDEHRYEDGGGVQFVDFVTSQGTFQLAVYNAHNGYYGHPILVAIDDEKLLEADL